jgi:ligand-binding sensor domain-containing protein
MKSHSHIYLLFLMVACCISCRGQNKTDPPKDNIKAEAKQTNASHGPDQITRNIIQDRKGNIWIAAFDGIFKYDGKSFTNITSKISSAHFFSVLEDRKGNFWFGSTGSGAYYYDGKTFRNFTTKEGLSGNGVTCIYEDKTGNIWFGTEGGASRYNGKTFRNYTTKDGLPDNDVNAIIEDRTEKLWFGTRGYACIYDGKAFTIIRNHSGRTSPIIAGNDSNSFTNVRSIIEDKKGNIWLGGCNGLWRYNGNTFTNFSHSFIGAVYEDKKGNIWTSSQKTNLKRWALSRYDEKLLTNKKPTVTEINSAYENNIGMISGILEAHDGSIWFGASDGVYRYDGNTIRGFKGKGAGKWNYVPFPGI